MVKIFDGRKFARDKEKNLRRRVASLRARGITIPSLVSILVGDDPASRLYTRLKREAAGRIGVVFIEKRFGKAAKDEQIKRYINKLNKDPAVGGIMIQLPLPALLKSEQKEIVEVISPEKDVDCLTAINLGRLMMGESKLLPATVKAIWEILQEAGFDEGTVVGKDVCVLGSSDIVGKPLANLLINLGATVTVGHRHTENITALTRGVDIVISATGVPGLVKGEMVRKGAVVIDVGSPHSDIDFASVASRASFVTPVPGGVGPVTVVCLLENFLNLIAK